MFSVTLKECKVDTFAVGGNGGAGKDTSNTGVRITHPPSGAVGKATDSRSQLANKRLAFRRMAESTTFRGWAKIECSRLSGGQSIEQLLVEDMKPENLKVEVRTADGKWEEETSNA